MDSNKYTFKMSAYDPMWTWKGEDQIKFWIEKTQVKNNQDRLAGENALGKSLWSPQTGIKSARIYKNMRLAKPGDIVFHLVDNETISGVSVVSKDVDDTFVCLNGTQWFGRPGYRIELKEHKKIAPPLHRNDFLGNKKWEKELQEISENHTGLFYNKKLELNQGKYLTEAHNCSFV